jgi:hypothetical protein
VSHHDILGTGRCQGGKVAVVERLERAPNKVGVFLRHLLNGQPIR